MPSGPSVRFNFLPLVVPMSGWRRDTWWEDTGLLWVKPSPNLPSLESISLFTATVHYEALNISVGRRTPEAFQRIGAPWMDNVAVAELLNGRGLPGVKIVVTDRNAAEPSRVAAALLWALVKTMPDSLVFRLPRFDEHFGAARLREALVAGADPDSVLAGEKASVDAWRASVEQYLNYR